MGNNSATTRAYAKINLTLDVVGLRSDGYHRIDSIMQTIDLWDDVTVTVNDTEEVTIECDDPNVPCDSRNIAYKCAKAYLDYCKSLRGCHIKIEKHIPMEAGLGGGSADGGAVLILLNLLLGTGLSERDLMAISAPIGADIPFSIFRSTALCRGKGDVITPLPGLKKHYVVLVKPDFGVSTPLAYKAFDDKGIVTEKKTGPMARAMLNCEPIYSFVSNDLQRAIDDKRIEAIVKKLRALDADAASMTGSGSAVYGLYADEKKAKAAYNVLSKEYKCYMTVTR